MYTLCWHWARHLARVLYFLQPFCKRPFTMRKTRPGNLGLPYSKVCLWPSRYMISYAEGKESSCQVEIIFPFHYFEENYKRKPKENIHYTSTRMVKLKKTKKKSKVRIWDKWNAQILLVGVLAIQPFWKPVWQYQLKLSICTPSDPVTPLSGVPDRDANMCSPQDTTRMFTTALRMKAKN